MSGKITSIPLPSKGLLYPKESPLYGKESVNIKEMTATEEDIMASKDLWKNGAFMDELIKACVVDQDIKSHLDELLLGDRNVIIVSIRAYGIGSIYKTGFVCPKCGRQDDYDFDLSKLKAKGICTEEGIDIDKLSNNFSIILNKSKANVMFKLLTNKESNEINTTNDRQKKLYNTKNDRLVTLRMKKMITSVDGNTDGSKISEFVDNLSAMDSKQFRDYSNKISPDIAINELVDCKDCGNQELVEMPPINASFFWPK
jgi:hypothetical protein